MNQGPESNELILKFWNYLFGLKRLQYSEIVFNVIEKGSLSKQEIVIRITLELEIQVNSALGHINVTKVLLSNLAMYITDCRQKCKWQKSKIRNDPWNWDSYQRGPWKQNVFDQRIQVNNFQKGPFVYHFIRKLTDFSTQQYYFE